MRTSIPSFPAILLVVLLAPLSAWAPTPVLDVEYSPDITVDLSTSIVVDEETALDVLVGAPTPASVGLPTSTSLTAFHMDDTSTTDVLFAVDVPTVLGAITASPEDVVRLDTTGPTYTLEFDGSVEGVPTGVHVDAVAVAGGNLILSFNTTVALGAATYDDEDLVERTAPSTFAPFFDGSVSGVASTLDVVGAHVAVANGSIFVSFDGSGTVGAVSFDDEDVLEFDPNSAWSLAYDGSALHAGWTPGDLDALDVSTDLDGDGVPDALDNCPTVPDPNQTDTDTATAAGSGIPAAPDGVGDVCDNCLVVANPRIVPLAFQTTTGGQLDDDVDGFGNHCDADFNNTDNLINPTDLALFVAANGKKRNKAVACSGGPCDIYDINGVDNLINPNDLARFIQLNGTKKNKKQWKKCAACPLP